MYTLLLQVCPVHLGTQALLDYEDLQVFEVELEYLGDWVPLGEQDQRILIPMDRKDHLEILDGLEFGEIMVLSSLLITLDIGLQQRGAVSI